MQTIHLLLSIVQVALALLLIGIIAIQQTKSEGLGGTIGGQVSSAFKGKPGFEERLTLWTRNLGVGFFVVSILVALAANR